MSNLKTYEMGEGKDWNANDKIAWGKGDVHKDFQGLQTDLNRFADVASFDKLDVDGFLGPATVEAFTKIYGAAIEKNPGLIATPFPPPKTKEDAAEYAQFIRMWLQGAAASALLAEASA